MHKYNVGQQIKIRSGLKAETYIDGVFINSHMASLSGHIFTITKQTFHLGRPVYYLKMSGWTWPEKSICDNGCSGFINLIDYV